MRESPVSVDASWWVPSGADLGSPSRSFPRMLLASHCRRSPELPAPGWTASRTVFFPDKRKPGPLAGRDLWALSPGLTGPSSSVTEVPHLHEAHDPSLPGETPATKPDTGLE